MHQECDSTSGGSDDPARLHPGKVRVLVTILNNKRPNKTNPQKYEDPRPLAAATQGFARPMCRLRVSPSLYAHVQPKVTQLDIEAPNPCALNNGLGILGVPWTNFGAIERK